MPAFHRPDGTLYEYDEPRHQRNQRARYDRYEEYYPPSYADAYDYEMEEEYYRYPRRGFLPNGCATLLLVVVVALAFVVLLLLTFHPQGFQLIHF